MTDNIKDYAPADLRALRLEAQELQAIYQKAGKSELEKEMQQLGSYIDTELINRLKQFLLVV